MSKFFSKKYNNLEPYVPGEQPKNIEKLIKLNTNESPWDVPVKAFDYLKKARNPRLYSDYNCTELRDGLSKMIKVDASQIIFGNGSDETLFFCFKAFCDEDNPALFADITYGFYEVFSQITNVPYKIAKLNDDFTINIDDYKNSGCTIFLANPNAWTAIALSLDDIEDIVKSNPNNVVVVDEAYVDFGADSSIPLVNKYENLIIVQTFSKSRSMAGGRLSFAVANKNLIDDLNTIKFSVNPYNVNSFSQALGLGILKCDEQIKQNINKVIECRQYTIKELQNIGFDILPSSANFVLAKSAEISGFDLYSKLKENGILVRYSNQEKLSDYVRITIGTLDQMKVLIESIKEILEK